MQRSPSRRERGLDFEKRVRAAELRLEHELRAIVDGLPERGAAFVSAMVRVTVDDGLYMVEAVDRLGQALRAEVLEDLVRLALQSVGDWGVMKDGDATFRAQSSQRILQLARFLHDFV